jgi:hydroxyacylglutathione hydrolase
MQNIKNITILPAFGDNYIYLLEYSPGCCFVVDPGDSAPVLNALDDQQLQLTHVLITHHHADHTGGIRTLKEQIGCTIIGPDANRISGLDMVISDSDTMKLGDVLIRCISTPGHTATSVCYFVVGNLLQSPVLFTGDTMFVCGCGRVLECSMQTMFESLQRLTALSDETHIYPGHNYTEENIRFALKFHPGDEQLQKKLQLVQKLSSTGQPTVPSLLSEEKQLNPFLGVKDWQSFEILRRKKDVF